MGHGARGLASTEEAATPLRGRWRGCIEQARPGTVNRAARGSSHCRGPPYMPGRRPAPRRIAFDSRRGRVARTGKFSLEGEHHVAPKPNAAPSAPARTPNAARASTISIANPIVCPICERGLRDRGSAAAVCCRRAGRKKAPATLQRSRFTKHRRAPSRRARRSPPRARKPWRHRGRGRDARNRRRRDLPGRGRRGRHRHDRHPRRTGGGDRRDAIAARPRPRATAASRWPARWLGSSRGAPGLSAVVSARLWAKTRHGIGAIADTAKAAPAGDGCEMCAQLLRPHRFAFPAGLGLRSQDLQSRPDVGPDDRVELTRCQLLNGIILILHAPHTPLLGGAAILSLGMTIPSVWPETPSSSGGSAK